MSFSIGCWFEKNNYYQSSYLNKISTRKSNKIWLNPYFFWFWVEFDVLSCDFFVHFGICWYRYFLFTSIQQISNYLIKTIKHMIYLFFAIWYFQYLPSFLNYLKLKYFKAKLTISTEYLVNDCLIFWAIIYGSVSSLKEITVALPAASLISFLLMYQS